MARGTTGGSVLKVLSGNAGAQAIALAASLVIARVFAPQAFGAYATLAALVAIAGTVGALRLEMSIPMADTALEAEEAVRSAVSTILVVTTGTAVLLAVAGAEIAAVLGLPDGAGPALWLALLAALLAALFTTLNQQAIRDQRFGLIASRAVVTAAATAVVQIVLGLLAPSLYSLLAGLVVGQGVGVALLARGVGVHPPQTPGATLAHARRYRQLPLYLAPSTLINSAGLQAPVLLGAAVFGPAFAGWFGMTQRMIAAPVTIIGASIGQVFLGELSALRRDRSADLEQRFLRTSAWLAGGGLVIGLILLALGPWAFETLLGERYAMSGDFARALAVGVALQVVASPLAVATVVMGRASWQAVWDVARLLSLLALFAAADSTDLAQTTTVWCLSLVNAGLYVCQWALSYIAIRRGVRSWHG